MFYLLDIKRISENIEDLQTEFTELKMSLHLDIESKNVPEKRLAIAVMSPLPHSWGEHDRFFSENHSTFDTPQSSYEVYNTVNRYSDYFNYGLIQQLTHLFGSPDTKSRMKTYVSKIETFRKNTSLLLYAKAQHPPQQEISSDLRSIVTKHKWTNATLEDVEQFRRKQARQFCLLHFIAIISSIEEGSVVLTWLIPKLIASYLTKRIMITHDDLFQESGITHVEMEGITLYSSSSTTMVRKGVSLINYEAQSYKKLCTVSEPFPDMGKVMSLSPILVLYFVCIFRFMYYQCSSLHLINRAHQCTSGNHGCY